MANDKLLGRKGNELRDQLSATSGHYDCHDQAEDENCYFAKFEPPQEFDLGSYAHSTDLPDKIGKAKMEYREFTQKVREIITEFFSCGVIAETVEALRSLGSPSFHDYFPYIAIRLSLDGTDAEQQKTAELLTVLCDSKVLSRTHLSRGFEKLIQSTEDFLLDVPDASDRVMTFFVCASEDGLVDHQFILRLPEPFLESLMPTAQDDVSIQNQLTQLKTFKTACTYFEGDFFNSGDIREVQLFLSEHPKHFHHEFVKLLLKSSFDRSDWEREMVSKTFSECFGSSLSPDAVLLGFSRLLASLDDLALDCPDASVYFSKFVVRAVIDEVLPPIFVKHQKRLNIGGVAGRAALEKAQGWLKQKKGHMLSQQFRKIWTGTDPHRQEARDFKKEMRTTIFEFFDNCDIDEALQCFNQMDLSPDQATEGVRKVMIFAMERSAKDCDLAMMLLDRLKEAGEITDDNLHAGFDQTYRSLADLSIDVPDAEVQLHKFKLQAIEKGLLSSDYEDPTR